VGCFEIEYHLQIKPGGEESITCKIGMPAIFGIQSDELAKRMEENGYKVNIETEGDKLYIIGKRISPKGQWFLPYPENIVKEKVKFEPSYKNLIFMKFYSLKAEYILDQNEVNKIMSQSQTQYSQSIRIPIRYIISAPGKIYKHNSDEISGDKLIWKYTVRPNEKIYIEFSSYEINYPVSLVTLGIIIILGYLGLRRVQQKKTQKSGRRKEESPGSDSTVSSTPKQDKDKLPTGEPALTKKFKTREEYERWKDEELGRRSKK
jgi:hypothetical protein